MTFVHDIRVRLPNGSGSRALCRFLGHDWHPPETFTGHADCAVLGDIVHDHSPLFERRGSLEGRRSFNFYVTRPAERSEMRCFGLIIVKERP
jgi:hypothetical protein